MLKKLLLGLGAVVSLVVLGFGGFVFSKVSAFDESAARVWSVPLATVTRSDDPEVLARGKHLVESIGACFDCHRAGGGGGRDFEMGPVGDIIAPNITTGRGGKLAEYSDGELARLIVHGIKRDGHSVLMMPSRDFSWWPTDDVNAVISYLRTLPAIDNEIRPVTIKPLGKVLDRLGKFPIVMADLINHEHLPTAPAPAPTKDYGAVLGSLCMGCHGDGLSGGRIPGTPPEIPIPLNLTPDATGLKDWSYADFEKFMRTGTRRNGQQVHPFMPMETMKAMNDIELQALWAYLQSVPAKPMGGR